MQVHSTSLVFLATVSLFLPSLANAESVLWSEPQPDLVYLGQGQATAYLLDPMVSITYRAQAFQSDASGEKLRPLTNGEILPVGSWLLLEFPDHAYTDIYWFGTGYTYDTPYGDWLANAAPPPSSERCSPKNLYQASAAYTGGSTRPRDLYAALSVNPPVKKVEMGGQPSSCEPFRTDGSLLCRLEQPGTVSAKFTFAPTTGRFYGGQIALSGGDVKYGCLQRDTPLDMWAGSGKSVLGTFILGVPKQSISFTLTVTADDPEAHAPNAPTLAAENDAACTVGTPHTITFSATDPDGDNIRYGIDWDADGSVDQWVPPSGYVPSGTSQAASRTYALAGEKTVKILAQDEGGLSSSWATVSFDCAESTAVTGLEGGGSGTGTGGGGADIAFPPPAADLDLRVIPSLVRKGDTTKVNWSSENVQSCTVSAPNGDAWSGLQSPIGGETSSPIQGQTTYTLSCIDLDGLTQTKQATVRILPIFQEL